MKGLRRSLRSSALRSTWIGSRRHTSQSSPDRLNVSVEMQNPTLCRYPLPTRVGTSSLKHTRPIALLLHEKDSFRLPSSIPARCLTRRWPTFPQNNGLRVSVQLTMHYWERPKKESGEPHCYYLSPRYRPCWPSSSLAIRYIGTLS